MEELTVVLCLVLTAVATVTDVARHSIYNWNTYPGILLALALRGFAGWDWLVAGIEGLVACGGVMLLCFVLFDVGGGDVKLLAMVGAWLGMQSGIEVMLWTFVIGSMAAVAVVIWQTGLWVLISGVARHVWLVVTSRGKVPLDEHERESLQRRLYLAPACLIGLLIVECPALWHRLGNSV